MTTAPQLLAFGGVIVLGAITAAWFFAVASLVAALRRLISRSAVRRAADGLSGVVLIGLGVRLALTTAR
ncbi:LysE family transporter [Micromonospora soli]|uniref:LysE family transporter n=1 Tax=Micromonospora sp. NBRC 110009 TaxID=3061627 RepID=UPI0026713A52|nr:LysE family transporter [Micromonospora sp. NBRC 110009]WKU01169.1 LysE family transporter [Micromonospora sp. NBRC 110009]